MITKSKLRAVVRIYSASMGVAVWLKPQASSSHHGVLQPTDSGEASSRGWGA